jgi:hypothetical protein
MVRDEASAVIYFLVRGGAENLSRHPDLYMRRSRRDNILNMHRSLTSPTRQRGTHVPRWRVGLVCGAYLMRRIAIVSLCCFGLTSFAPADAGETQVTLQKTPDHGIQPQAIVEANGRLHLVYFQGKPEAGDLMYVRRDAGQSKFSAPLRVNSQEGSAIAVGSIRGGQLAIGRNGRVHVAWNGSGQAAPKNPIIGTPMLYTRQSDDGSAFEPQRNLMTQSAILDGGGAVAADGEGNVYVAWQGLGKELVKGEDNRKVWVSISRDDGKTFAAERPAWNEKTGACACCGMKGFADRQGNAYILYRAASQKTNRGMYLLQSADHGKSFAGLQLDLWPIDMCPMSSEAFAEGPAGTYAAWDTEGQVYFTRIQPGKTKPDEPSAAPGKGQGRKHPAMAVNKQGELILVWTEGTGWNRGGGLAWQVYDKAGRPTSESGRRAGAVPVWGLPTVIAEPDGRFTIFH